MVIKAKVESYASPVAGPRVDGKCETADYISKARTLMDTSNEATQGANQQSIVQLLMIASDVCFVVNELSAICKDICMS